MNQEKKKCWLIKKRKRTSEIWQYGLEIIAKEENSDRTYKAFQCSYCSWIGKITASGSTTIVRHHFRVCKPWLEEQKRKLVDNTADEYTHEVAVRTPSHLTTASSQNSAPVVVVEPKVQTILVGS